MGTIYVCFSQGNSSLQACLNLDQDSPTPLHPALRLWAFVCACVCGGRFHVSRDILACCNRRSTSVINQINNGWIAFMSSGCMDLSDWHGLLESCNYCFYEYDSVLVSTLNIQPPFYSPFLLFCFGQEAPLAYSPLSHNLHCYDWRSTVCCVQNEVL